MTRGRAAGVVAGGAAFAAVVGVAIALLPSALGLLYRCAPGDYSCGDGIVWAMLITAPITVPVILMLAGVVAVHTYRAVTRGKAID